MDTINPDYFNPEAPLHIWQRHIHEVCSQGKGASLSILRVETGWYYKCHRCGLKGFKTLKGLSPSQTVKFIKSSQMKQTVAEVEVVLPSDYTVLIPPQGLAWLYKYITNEDIIEYKIGYSKYLNRVVLPVYVGGTLIYWQGRYLGEVDRWHPKYNNIKQKGRKDIYFSVRGPTSDSTQLVLVEDMISAINVGKVAHCTSLLGSYISDDLMMRISKVYSNVMIWLDADKVQESLRYVRRFKTFNNVHCKMIYSKKDPKGYNLTEIERRLM